MAGARRKASGEIQSKLWDVYDKRAEYESAIEAYENQIEKIDEARWRSTTRPTLLDTKRGLKDTERRALDSLDATIATTKIVARGLKTTGESIEEHAKEVGENLITFVGTSVNAGAPASATIEMAGSIAGFVVKQVAENLEALVETWASWQGDSERQPKWSSSIAESDVELRQMGREMQASLREESELRLDLFLAADNFAGAQTDYDASVAKGHAQAEGPGPPAQALGRARSRRSATATWPTASSRTTPWRSTAQQFELAQTVCLPDRGRLRLRDQPERATTRPRAPSSCARSSGERTLGEMRVAERTGTPVPIAGSHGLADALAGCATTSWCSRGRWASTTRRTQANRFSLRHELLRLRDTSDAKWRQDAAALLHARHLRQSGVVAKLAKRPYGDDRAAARARDPVRHDHSAGPATSLACRWGPATAPTTRTQFATKIASVGVWFDGYDTKRLARMPYVYLLPAGQRRHPPAGHRGRAALLER